MVVVVVMEMVVEKVAVVVVVMEVVVPEMRLRNHDDSSVGND